MKQRGKRFWMWDANREDWKSDNLLTRAMVRERHYGREVGHLGALRKEDDTVNGVETDFSNLTRTGFVNVRNSKNV
jgi:hypothetical protein